jgi:DNA-binding NtrC family response regulator
MKYILIASNNQFSVKAIKASLSPEYVIEHVVNRKACDNKIKKKRFDFLFIDILFFPEESRKNSKVYKKELQHFWAIFPTMQIIVLGPQEKIKEAVNAVKAGAVNYLTYPIDPIEVKLILESTYDSIIQESELNYLRDQVTLDESQETDKTNNHEMKKVYDKVHSVATAKTTVLITGETGTGKGVIAGLIHRLSKRPENKFISVHCGAIPDNLIESELFGHEKGSFTGAIKRKLGKFEIAQGGTIFLDEIGTITQPVQVKLLQILHDRTFQRVGGEETLKCDARIIAATNNDLKQMSENNTFRRDLYYRLSVFPIEVPPLRERKEDISIFIDVFLKRLNTYYFKDIYKVHSEVLSAFQKYAWPGNIRELENLIERAYLLETSPVLTPDSFPNELFLPEAALAVAQPETTLTLQEIRRKGIENVERSYFRELLTMYKGSIKNTAKASGITPRQVHKLLTKYGIKKEAFKIPKSKELKSEP